MAYTTVRTQTLTVTNLDRVKRGFLRTVVEYAAKRGTFTTADLCKRFVGKVAPTKGGVEAKVTTARIVRYAYWCVQEGIMAPVESGAEAGQ